MPTSEATLGQQQQHENCVVGAIVLLTLIGVEHPQPIDRGEMGSGAFGIRVSLRWIPTAPAARKRALDTEWNAAAGGDFLSN